jgi:hypothetical protein
MDIQQNKFIAVPSSSVDSDTGIYLWDLGIVGGGGDYIKMWLKGKVGEDMDWIQLAQDRVQRWAICYKPRIP